MLAALGSAIGLGNIWRFSYVVGENGGGAFILVYVVAVALIGLPLLIAELAIGRRTRAGPVKAFARVGPRLPWRWTGWFGVVGALCILAYYPVISGWVMRYLWVYAFGSVPDAAGLRFVPGFEAYVASPGPSVLWTVLVIVIAGSVVAFGIERGIERASSLLMPVFGMIILVLAGHGLSLPGASHALEFLFIPDWAVLERPVTYLAAVGQAFFSIGLAMGILVAFGSYLPPGINLPRAAIAIAGGDTLVALVAGLIVFPAAFTYGFDPAQGPTLAFVVLPQVFAAMPGGRWVAVGFYLLLLMAALTSVIALLEVLVSLLMAKVGGRRLGAALAATMAALLLALPSALSYSILRRVFAEPLVERMDHVSSNIVLPLSGIAVSLFAGWVWPAAEAVKAAGLPQRWPSWLWLWLLRFLIPLAVALVLLGGLGVFLDNPSVARGLR